MLMEAPIVLFFGLYEGANRYRICFEVLAEHPTAGGDERSAAATLWIERYVRRLEHYARAAPYNWSILRFLGEVCLVSRAFRRTKMPIIADAPNAEQGPRCGDA